MAIDLKRFHGIFFAESLEQLDTMEAELLKLNLASIEDESINTIFRAAHSIKGGSATFGFPAIVGLTHTLETLLDEIRSGQSKLSKAIVDLLLQSVDCLRESIARYKNDQDIDDLTCLKTIQAQIEDVASMPESRDSTIKPTEQAANVKKNGRLSLHHTKA